MRNCGKVFRGLSSPRSHPLLCLDVMALNISTKIIGKFFEEGKGEMEEVQW